MEICTDEEMQDMRNGQDLVTEQFAPRNDGGLFGNAFMDACGVIEIKEVCWGMKIANLNFIFSTFNVNPTFHVNPRKNDEITQILPW